MTRIILVPYSQASLACLGWRSRHLRSLTAESEEDLDESVGDAAQKCLKILPSPITSSDSAIVLRLPPSMIRTGLQALPRSALGLVGQHAASSSRLGLQRHAFATSTRKQAGPSKIASAATPAPSAFPCIDANEARTARILASQGPILDSPSKVGTESEGTGPEPSYSNIVSGYKVFHHSQPYELDYGGELPEFDIAYETWGQLNDDKSNAILLHTGLSASSHAASHPDNTVRGWWEDFIGPGKALDTDKFFVICTNVLGGCYGSTGPSSKHPLDPEGAPYATRFPILSIFDMVRAQFLLLDNLGIDSLYASIGSSMGGMQSVAAAHLFPNRVQRLVSISGCARSAPSSIALRFAQRSVLMSDENFKRGYYYGGVPPHTGMKMARQIATITYRSGPELETRFGRRREGTEPALCPDFLIERYLDHQGEKFCLTYDPNSLLYVSKAMDLFDMSQDALDDLEQRKRSRGSPAASETSADSDANAREAVQSAENDAAAVPVSVPTDNKKAGKPRRQYIQTLSSSSAHIYLPSLAKGLQRLSNIPTLIIGVQSDILFPVDQQRELAECLRRNGNTEVRYYELDSALGHDSFLLDVQNFGGAIKGFL